MIRLRNMLTTLVWIAVCLLLLFLALSLTSDRDAGPTGVALVILVSLVFLLGLGYAVAALILPHRHPSRMAARWKCLWIMLATGVFTVAIVGVLVHSGKELGSPTADAAVSGGGGFYAPGLSCLLGVVLAALGLLFFVVFVLFTVAFFSGEDPLDQCP